MEEPPTPLALRKWRAEWQVRCTREEPPTRKCIKLFSFSLSSQPTSTSSSTSKLDLNKQGRVRVALNDANRARKGWEAATSEGAAAATEWANAVLQEA